MEDGESNAGVKYGGDEGVETYGCGLAQSHCNGAGCLLICPQILTRLLTPLILTMQSANLLAAAGSYALDSKPGPVPMKKADGDRRGGGDTGRNQEGISVANPCVLSG